MSFLISAIRNVLILNVILGLACASCHMVTVSNPPSLVFTDEQVLKGQFTSNSCFCHSLSGRRLCDGSVRLSVC